MRTNTVDANRQIAQMKKHLRILEGQKSNSEKATKEKEQEIEEFERKLWDYEASTPTLPRARLKTWRTVTVGDKTLAQYEEAINGGDGNYKLSSSLGLELFRKLPTLKSGEKVVKLGKMNVQQLGFRRAYLDTLFDAIKKLGGRHCPPEVALALACDPEFDIKDDWPSQRNKPAIYRDDISVKFFMKGYMMKDSGPWMFEIEEGVIHDSGNHGYGGGDFPYNSIGAYTVNKNPRHDEVIIFMIPDNVRS